MKRYNNIPGDDNVSYPETIIPPPSDVLIITRDARPILYDANGTPLVKNTRIGFNRE